MADFSGLVRRLEDSRKRQAEALARTEGELAAAREMADRQKDMVGAGSPGTKGR